MTQFDNTFNIKRFKNLCHLLIANRWKRDSLGSLLLFTLSALITYFIFRFSGNALSEVDGGAEILNKVDSILLSEKASQMLSSFVAIIGAAYIISYVKELSPKHPRTSVYLMLPVSAFERIASIFLFGSLIYIIATTLLLILGINLGLFVAGLKIEAFSFNFIPLFKGRYSSLFTNAIFLQLSYLIGGFYFRKSAFMKTTLVVILISAVYQLINSLTLALFTKIATPFDTSFKEILSVAATISSQPAVAGFEDSIFYSNLLITPVVFICFWSFAYFKIKEKEIK